MEAKGKVMLKVASILYIVCGGLWVLGALIALVASSLLANMTYGIWAWFGSYIVIAFLIAAAVNLVIGIIGVKQSADPSKAMFFIVTGIVLGVLAFISIFSSFLTGLVGLVLPVLFIVGGFQNKNSVQQTQSM